jgi:predicted ATPase
MLLLLDNLEQVIESAGELSRLLSTCPNLTLLITSRELLRVTGEVEFAVAPLTEPEGVALFCERAQLEPTDAIVELCRRLDSLPLALELAAARTKALSPAQIVDRLSQRLDLLKAGRDVDPRQQTLRAAIAWSYELLSDEERRLFAHLGVFAGGWTLEPAETVCGAEVEILESLATKSLVRYDNGRYRMLELIRGYAAERLAESGDRESVQDAHAEWVTNLASEADVALRCAAQTGWLERVSVEHDNVRAALAHRLERDAPAAARLAAALAWFWQLRSYLGEGEAWLARVFAAAPQADTEVRAALLQGRGQLAYYREEYGTATQLLEESASAWRGVGNERRLAEALTYLGLARSLGADAERTRQTLDDAVAVARRSAESWTLGLALWALGTSVMFGRCASTHDGEARTCLEESVDHLRVAGDAWALGGPLYYLGWIELQAGNTTAARPFFEEARALFVAVGDKYRLLRALQRLTEIARAEGDERLAQQLQHERDRCAGEFGTLKLVTAVAS